jgi:spore maturation protein CgeB
MRRVLLNARSGLAGLREAFASLGYEVIENAWRPGAAELEGTALCIADFVDCARRLRRSLGLARRLRRARVPFIALNRDAPWHRGVHPARLAAIGWLAPFDGYATHSLQDAGRFARRLAYCPNAARESAYHASAAELARMREPSWFRWDVSFIGNLDVARYAEHTPRVQFLQALQQRLQPLGVALLIRDASGLGAEAQREIIQASRINLSVLAACDAGREPSWGLPERCYGVPACGGFLLSDRRRHAAEDFAPEEWADFADLEDCVRRIREFLAHPEVARAIAERAHARVVRDHGYRRRAERLLEFAREVR